jgi:hypothetical protein
MRQLTVLIHDQDVTAVSSSAAISNLVHTNKMPEHLLLFSATCFGHSFNRHQLEKYKYIHKGRLCYRKIQVRT